MPCSAPNPSLRLKRRSPILGKCDLDNEVIIVFEEHAKCIKAVNILRGWRKATLQISVILFDI